jgi:hypothetical protein
MRRFVFITGAGRCGTKLMHSLLDGNTNLNIIPGEVTNFFLDSLDRNGFSDKVYHVNSKKILENIINEFKGTKFPNLKSKLKRISKLLNNKFSYNSSILFEDYMNIVTNVLFPNKKQTVINIQNENIIGLLQTFPTSKIIHIIRNPLTQINSRYLFRYKIPNNYNGMEFSSSFYRNYNSFKNAFLMRDNKRVMVVKMESLIKSTKKEMKKTSKFLSISFNKINLITSLFGKKISDKDTYIKSNSGIRSLDNDFSCLSPNDLYIVSKIKYVNKFYKLKQFSKKKNSFIFFLLRHLGFVGKKRSKIFNPYKLIKYSIYSIYLFFLDKNLKNQFLMSKNI